MFIIILISSYEQTETFQDILFHRINISLDRALQIFLIANKHKKISNKKIEREVQFLYDLKTPSIPTQILQSHSKQVIIL
jgi:hypothetical protein